MLEILTCMIVLAEECVVLEALRRGFEDCFGCLEVLDLNEIAIQDRAWCGSWNLVINAVRPDSLVLCVGVFTVDGVRVVDVENMQGVLLRPSLCSSD